MQATQALENFSAMTTRKTLFRNQPYLIRSFFAFWIFTFQLMQEEINKEFFPPSAINTSYLSSSETKKKPVKRTKNLWRTEVVNGYIQVFNREVNTKGVYGNIGKDLENNDALEHVFNSTDFFSTVIFIHTADYLRRIQILRNTHEWL